jgi:phage tail protein X
MGEDPGQIRQQIEETRAQMGDTVDALAYKADVKERAKDSITEKKERAVESIAQTKDKLVSSVTGAGDRVGDAAPSADQVKEGTKRAAGVAQENPIGLAIGGVAIGFLAGMMIPSTRIEDRRMGEVADQAKEKAREAGQEAFERGKTVVQETAETAAETAREKSSERAQELGQSTQQKAQETVQA